MYYIRVLIVFLCVHMTKAVTVEMPRAHDVLERDIDTDSYVIDNSMLKFVGEDRRVINKKGHRVYQFHNAKVDSCYICGNDQYATWEIIDSRCDTVCLFNLIVFPSRYDALKLAVSQHPSMGMVSMNEKNTCVETSNGYTAIGHKCANKNGLSSILHMEKEGILLHDIRWRKGHISFSIEEKKQLLRNVLNLISSNKAQKDYTEEVQNLRNKKVEELRLRSYPGYLMSKRVEYRHIKKKIFPDVPTGDSTFLHPKHMWNRPSLNWFQQFQHNITNTNLEWNERGDIIHFDIPENKHTERYRCGITIAHTISESDALRFMEGFALEGNFSYSNLAELKRRIDKHVYKKDFIGAHAITLKPQLDDSGALIPNSDESDICFVRNNTAVRVVADRPDVSVLWIAKKIDEELIAAGKGEPPTWSPPTPASAARQQPVAVPSTQL